MKESGKVNNEKIISRAISINIETRNFFVNLAEKTSDRNLKEVLLNIGTVKENYIKFLINKYIDSNCASFYNSENSGNVIFNDYKDYNLSNNDSIYKLAIDLCNKTIRYYLKNIGDSSMTEYDNLLTELISMEHEHINCFNYMLAV